ncbi:hypothetical protein AK812_SmicGene20698 [Symbiodinium microadriaticum]|uniref:Uncharacterized protein n=1 Tax=Symbiodinium microadriaticum TaxID=2951 RepID=A0A1Q9DP93_SYMMI|nr:hypothetical protein AK812_SmicGene20698 [Symbiodinium microadriaticum]
MIPEGICEVAIKGGDTLGRADDIGIVEESKHALAWLQCGRNGVKGGVLGDCVECRHQGVALLPALGLQDLVFRADIVGPDIAALGAVELASERQVKKLKDGMPPLGQVNAECFIRPPAHVAKTHSLPAQEASGVTDKSTSISLKSEPREAEVQPLGLDGTLRRTVKKSTANDETFDAVPTFHGDLESLCRAVYKLGEDPPGPDVSDVCENLIAPLVTIF